MKRNSKKKIAPVEEYFIRNVYNGRKKEYPKTFVHKIFEDICKNQPDTIAVSYLEKEITYKSLNDRANKLANYLKKKDIKRGDIVFIAMERTIETIIAVLAVHKSSAAYIPVEPTFPEGLVKSFIDDACPKLIITTERYKSKLMGFGKVVLCLDEESQNIEKESIRAPRCELTESDVAYAIYTSGSSGRRKAAVIEHKGLTNQCYAWKDALNITKNDTTLQSATLSFDVFTADWIRALTSGAKMVINPYDLTLFPETDKSGEKLYKLIVSNNITFIDLTPAVIRRLIKYAKKEKKPLDFLRLIVVGCDTWYLNEHKDLIGITNRKTRVINSYGMSEGTVDTSYYEEYYDEYEGNSLIGRPYTNNEIYILNSHNNLSPIGEVGEICISGVTLTRGYLNRPKLNKERFAHVRFSDGSVIRVYKSGDFGRYLRDGNLEFLGRGDNQIEIRGIRIELGEIEKLIQEHPDVFTCVVVNKKTRKSGNNLVCFVVPEKDAELNKELLVEHLVDKLPKFMIPQDFILIESLPLNKSAKVDRKSLKKIKKDTH